TAIKNRRLFQAKPINETTKSLVRRVLAHTALATWSAIGARSNGIAKGLAPGQQCRVCKQQRATQHPVQYEDRPSLSCGFQHHSDNEHKGPASTSKNDPQAGPG